MKDIVSFQCTSFFRASAIQSVKRWQTPVRTLGAADCLGFAIVEFTVMFMHTTHAYSFPQQLFRINKESVKVVNSLLGLITSESIQMNL
jgi:hypothetical protein